MLRYLRLKFGLFSVFWEWTARLSGRLAYHLRYVKRLKSAPLLLFVSWSIPSSTLDFSQKYMTVGLFSSRIAPTDACWSTSRSYIEHQPSHPRARLNFVAGHLQVFADRSFRSHVSLYIGCPLQYNQHFSYFIPAS